MMTTGVFLMQMLYADNLDMEEQHWPIRVLILVKGLGKSCWITCGVLEQKPLSFRVHTEESTVTIVGTVKMQVLHVSED